MRELGRSDADPAGDRVNQDPLTPLNVCQPDHGGVRGSIHDGNCGSLLEAERVGQGERVVLAHDHELREPSEPGPGDDAVADLPEGHAFADRFDGARDLVSENRRRFGCVGIQPLARHDVREVDARRADRDPDLTATRHRLGLFANLQNLGCTVSRQHERFHGFCSCRAALTIRS